MECVYIIIIFLVVSSVPSFNSTSNNRTPIGKTKVELPCITRVHLMPLIDLIAIRPQAKTKGHLEYPHLFATHPDISCIKLINVPPEDIAAAFLKIRLDGVKKYPDQQWSHRFIKSMTDHLVKVGVSQEVIDAIKGYHSLKMRHYHETRSRKDQRARRVEMRNVYMKKYRERQKEIRRKLRDGSSSSLNNEAPPMLPAPAIVTKTFTQLMRDFDHRPSPLEIEERLRQIRDLYPTAKHAAYAMRVYMEDQHYTAEEVKVASGARTQFLREIKLRKRKEATRKRQREAQEAAVEGSIHTYNTPPLGGEQRQSEDVSKDRARHEEVEPLLEESNWWDHEYDM